MTKDKYSLSGSGKVTTYNWMVKSAELALSVAQEKEEGQFYQSMNVLVYSAFAMEAFFNHIGLQLHDDWEKKERNLSKYKKLKSLKSQLGIKGNLNSEPFKSVFDVFDFRDLLAHGRTENIEKTETVELTPEELKRYMLGSVWMDYCTIENAERILPNIKAVITEMYRSAGLGEYPFLHFHSSVYSNA